VKRIMPTNNPSEVTSDNTTRRTFLGLPSQVPEVRRFLRRQLGDHPRAYDALVIGNELSTNAVEHTDSRRPAGAFTAALTTRADGTLRIEVTDQGGPDDVGLPRPEREGGRGFTIIEALAKEWGITGDATGRTVWVELPAEP
jgi:anti-sigma regulatory factor (Ser/Thr protein kinase)